MYKLAVFDMDGTILNTLDGLANSTNYALARCGMPTHGVEAYKAFVGSGVYQMIERALPENERTKENVERIVAVFREHYRVNSIANTKHYGDLPEVLQKLKDAGVVLAVASNKPPEFGRMYADHFFGEGFFDCVMGPSVDIPPKPEPKMLFEAIRRCGAVPEKTCYFGDSDIDIMTGVNAGVATAGVAWGFRPESELMAAGASRILHKYDEILDFVGVGS